MATRRLEDLYVFGKQVTIGDGQGDPVVVWLQKMNQVEGSRAVKAGNAGRARTLAAKKDAESDAYLAAWDQVLDMGEPDNLARIVAIDQVARKRDAIAAQVASQEKWSNDNYVQGLREAWESGLNATFLENPEDPEAKRIAAELEVLDAEIRKEVEAAVEDVVAQLVDLPLEALQEKVFDRILTAEADSAWLREYRRWELYYAIRDPDDHKSYYFENPDQVDLLSPTLVRRLRDHLDAILVEVTEGKD